MNCKDDTDRITEICSELLEIIDDSRAHCDNDECELLNCVVHDSVKNIRRVLSQLRPRGPIAIHPAIGELPWGTRRKIN